MTVHLLHAITLNSVKLGEVDRLLDLFSYKHGRVTCIARGAGRLKSRFGESAESITESKFWVVSKEGRDAVVAKEAVIINSFRAIHGDFTMLNLSFFVSEIISYFFKKGDPAPQFWLFLREFLMSITSRTKPILFAYFFIQTLHYSGLFPNNRCQKCGNALGSDTVYQNGVLLHLKCGNNGKAIRSCTLRPMFYLETININSLRTVKLSSDMELKIAETAYYIIRSLINKPLKTAYFWEDYMLKCKTA